jgi:hypothetical protein
MDQQNVGAPTIDPDVNGANPTSQDQGVQAAPPNLLTPEQQNTLFSELGLEDLPEERKETLMQSMVDTVMNRVFTRISPTLTDKDLDDLAALELQPDSDVAVNQFLLAKVPNLENIMREEIESFRNEMKETVAAVKDALPKQPDQQ